MTTESIQNSERVLKAVGLRKIFRKGNAEIPVVRGVDLEIHAGETVAITGASGVGKSTLLHLLGTLEKPTHGQVFFDGKDLFKLNEKSLSEFRNRNLGFVFQFHHLLPEFTALENVSLPGLIAGLSQAESLKRAQELLDLVGLHHRLEHRPQELSGGEQQRVAIARALVMKPQVLLADELTGNLDSANSGGIMELLLRLNESLGVSLVLVTHDLNVAHQMRRVLTMKDGLLV